jgi:hypothetical protein
LFLLSSTSHWYIDTSVRVRIRRFIDTYTSIQRHLDLGVDLARCRTVTPQIFVWLHVYVHMYMHMNVDDAYVFVLILMLMYTCICICMYMRPYPYTYTYMYMCACFLFVDFVIVYLCFPKCWSSKIKFISINIHDIPIEIDSTNKNESQKPIEKIHLNVHFQQIDSKLKMNERSQSSARVYVYVYVYVRGMRTLQSTRKWEDERWTYWERKMEFKLGGPSGVYCGCSMRLKSVKRGWFGIRMTWKHMFIFGSQLEFGPSWNGCV